MVSWIGVSGAYSYQVGYGVGASNQFYASDIFAPDTSVTLTGLTPGDVYLWRARACDGSGVCSPWSGDWSFGVHPSQPPLYLPGQGATNVAANPTLFEWTEANGDTDYILYLWDQQAGGGWVGTPSLGNTFYYDAQGLNFGHTYYWYIDGYGPAGGANSTTWSFTVAIPPASPPTLQSPGNNEQGVQNPVLLEWAATGSDIDFQYLYRPDWDQTWTGPTDVGGALEASIGSLTVGQKYDWEVYGCTVPPTCVLSALWSFTDGYPPSAPTLASPGLGATVSGTTVTLAWNPAANDTDYQYAYGPAGAPSLSPWVDVGNQFSAALSGLTPGQQYYWEVLGCLPSGVCANSSEWSFTVQAAGPTAPTLTAPPNGQTTTSTNVTFFWDQAGSDSDYQLYWQDRTTGETSFHGPNDAGTALYLSIDDIFHSGDTYAWYVNGCFGSSCVASLTWTFTAPIVAPLAPQLLQPSAGASGVQNPVAFSWAQAGGDSDHQILYEDYTIGGAWTTVDVGAQTSFSASLTPGHTYQWTVNGCTSGCAQSTPIRFDVYAPAPGTPQLSAPATFAVNTGTTPTLSWGAAPSLSTFVTYYDVILIDAQTNAVVGSQLQTTDPLTQVTVPASQGLVLGRSYNWQVAACNPATPVPLCSPWSSPWLFTTVLAPGAAQQQTPTNDATGVGTSPTFTWSAPTTADYPGETHFYLNLYDTISQHYVLTNADTGTNLSDATSALAPSDAFIWDVLACNGAQLYGVTCTGDTWFTFDAASASAPNYPGFTTSWYIASKYLQDATTLGCLATSLTSSSCSSCAADLTIPYHLVILEFGAQTTGQDPLNMGTTVDGTELAGFTNGVQAGFIANHDFDTNPNQSARIGGVEELAAAFLTGYHACAPAVPLTLVIGTNNSLDDSLAYGQHFGAEWADVVAAIATNASSTYGASAYLVLGGNDIEEDPPNGGDASSTHAWANMFFANAAGHIFYNFGSCDYDVCPLADASGCTFEPAAGDTSCILADRGPVAGSYNGSWYFHDVVTLAGADDQEMAIPEIYGPTQAQEWGYLLLYINASPGPLPGLYLSLPAILTQCNARDIHATDTPRQGWTDMFGVLLGQPWSYYLRGDNPLYSTDIGYEGADAVVPAACNGTGQVTTGP